MKNKRQLLAMIAVASLTIGCMPATTPDPVPTPDPTPIPEPVPEPAPEQPITAVPTLVENGSFANNSSIPWETPGWWSGETGTAGVDDRGRFCTTITTIGSEQWGVQLRQSDRTFIEGETYKVRFKAWSSAPASVVVGAVDETQTPGLVIFDSPNPPTEFITTNLDAQIGQAFEYEFVALASTEKARFRFLMGKGLIPEGETLCLDDIVVEPPAKNLISNPGFDNDGATWEVPGFWNGGEGSSSVDDQGRMCTTVTTEDANDWGAQLRQVGKKLVAGRTYTVKFDVWSSTDMTISYDVIDEAANYALLLQDPALTITTRLADTKPQKIEANFDVDIDSNNANFRFLLGGGNVPAGETICFDNVELLDPLGYSVYQPEEPEFPAVYVNQHGYAPSLAKIATYKLVENEAKTTRNWELIDANGVVVKTGVTQVIGDGETIDPNSGDLIHQIDFSNFNTPGTGYVLEVIEGEERISSYAFDISDSVFSQLKYDALSYFYHNRSGIEILASVVGDEKWARPAGHVSDSLVETFVCKDTPQSDDCYAIDVSGGWYDAGDHGKYVVNGGISTWTLLNQYERSIHLGRNSDDFDTGSMALPPEEKGNNLPDILDEAKWNIEFMLKMQVPEGKNFAGMVFHKMHNDGWTGTGLAPHEDTRIRYVQAPTTAATLNLAAVAAQCARVYETYDADLSVRCLAASKTALAAAKENPSMFSGKPAAGDANPERYSMTNDNGGGMYDDDYVLDEFFWALAELYATTKEETYKSELLDSELYGVYTLDYAPDDYVPGAVPLGLFFWGNTNMLGAISLATTGAAMQLEEAIVNKQIDLLIAAADVYVDIANEPGYNMPMDSTTLDWGSNSGIVNNMIVIGLANDLSCAQENTYVNAMAKGMTYLMGNNPLGTSYITGYGENAVQNPHHRFWANSYNENYPSPPPGVLSGGPNSTHAATGDPVSLAKVAADCPAETCFIDDIGSWSTNEITINWNSPLAWVTAYMDEILQQGLNQTCSK